LLPGDLAEKFDMAKTFKACRRSSKLANLAAYLVSDFSAYVNGEVVVIDGGEWLKVQDNSISRSYPEELWDQLEMMIKTKE
jgi:enoyl-[acyl-carrier-protein] reductase (NADH)